MVELVICLLFELEDLSLYSQLPQKKSQALPHVPVILALCRDNWIPTVCWLSQ